MPETDNKKPKLPLYLAPMAGVTHSAYRRLVADFGGTAALFSEMLSPGALLRENVFESPFTKRRPSEGPVIYQLLIGDGIESSIPGCIEALKPLCPDGIDLNLGCPAPEIKKRGAGSMLFDDYERCAQILDMLRKSWSGKLSVKCRLGKNKPGWEEYLIKMLKLFEDSGVNLVTIHPRFDDEKLKRIARKKLFPWLTSMTKIPVVANGDIICCEDIEAIATDCPEVFGVMIGRMAVVKPWLFAQYTNGLNVDGLDYLEIWKRYFEYVKEDFVPEKVLGRVKEFTAYYSRNFFFGHQLYTAVQSAVDVGSMYERAVGFLGGEPRVAVGCSVNGI